MNIKLNVKNILVATALGGALVLSGCSCAKEETGSVDVYSNNFEDSAIYRLKNTIDNYKPIDTDTYVSDENPKTDEYVQNEENNTYIVDNTIQDGDYFTVKEALLINTNKDTIIAKLELDTYVKVLGIDGDYYLVDYNGLIGYIDKDSIMPKQYVVYDDNSIEEYQPYIVRHIIRANSNADVKSIMDVNSETIGIMPKGKFVDIVSYENGWYSFNYYDSVAFVKDENVTEEVIVNGNILKLVYITNDTELLKEDSNEPIRSLEYYESAEVLGDLDEYYLVNVDNVVGRVRKDACVEIEGTTVVVDLSSQTLKLYDDNEVLLYSKVVTGKDFAPTDKGLYSINDKDHDVTLIINDEYEVDANYWLEFNNGEGFYDTTWREDYGGDIYHNNGTDDGCVNMSVAEAEVLYNHVDVGTKVLVHK